MRLLGLRLHRLPLIVLMHHALWASLIEVLSQMDPNRLWIPLSKGVSSDRLLFPNHHNPCPKQLQHLSYLNLCLLNLDRVLARLPPKAGRRQKAIVEAVGS